MAFIQLIDYRTTDPAAVGRILTEWIANTEGVRTARRTRVCVDRKDPTHYMEIVEFDSAEDADRNSRLAQTESIYAAFQPLCTDGPRFIDLDVTRDEQL